MPKAQPALSQAGDSFQAAEPPLLQLLKAPAPSFPQALLDMVPQQSALLQKTLSCIPLPLLHKLAASGVKLEVAPQGKELAELGVLRDQDVAAYEARLPELQAFTARLPEMLEGLEGSQRLHQLGNIVAASGLPLTTFTPRPGQILSGAPKLDPLQKASLDLLAMRHGARTPEEKSLFFELVRGINGERAEAALQDALEETQQHMSPQGWERQSKLPSELVPLDLTKHALVLPDLYFLHSPHGGPTLTIDTSDLLSVDGWQGDRGRISAANQLEEPFNGQYFFLGGSNRVLLRQEALAGKTPVHELGHVLDLLVEKENPEFYGPWRESLNVAFNQANAGSHSISNYSRANQREYFAEGFAHYFLHSENLQKQDPQLYGLVEQMVDFSLGKNRDVDLEVGRQFATLPKQLTAARNTIKEQKPDELVETAALVRSTFAKELASSGQAACLHAASLGLLAGAVESVLLREAGRQPIATMDADPSRYLQPLQDPGVDAAKVVAGVGQLVSQAQNVREAFDAGYQGGVVGEFFIK